MIDDVNDGGDELDDVDGVDDVDDSDGGVDHGDAVHELDDCDPVVVMECPPAERGGASGGVVEALAALEEIDPMDLPSDRGLVLYDHVHPDALDSIATDGFGGNVEIEFPVEGYRVRVTSDHIVVSAEP